MPCRCFCQVLTYLPPTQYTGGQWNFFCGAQSFEKMKIQQKNVFPETMSWFSLCTLNYILPKQQTTSTGKSRGPLSKDLHIVQTEVGFILSGPQWGHLWRGRHIPSAPTAHVPDNKMDACLKERLSEEICLYPHLYHLSLKEYKDGLMALNSWRENMQTLGRDRNA